MIKPKHTDLRATNETISQMRSQIDENNELIRENLLKIWDENQADYFSNPSRLVKKSEEAGETERAGKLTTQQLEKSLNSRKKSTKHSTNPRGMYAFAIWDNIREDTKRKLKHFNLERELQETMDVFIRNQRSLVEHSALRGRANSNDLEYGDDEDFEGDESKIHRLENNSQIRNIKALRNEIELMYRSSKLNEERVNTLKSVDESYEYEDDFRTGEIKDSICNYLPPIYLTEERSPTPNMKLSEINITSPIMRREYRKQLEMKKAEKNLPVDYQLRGPNDDKPKSVKLNYLPEKSSSEYGTKFGFRRTNEQTASSSTEVVIYDESKIKSPKDDEKQDLKPTEIISPPPLTMNALMEYKKSIKAPGVGDFSNGKPTIWKS